MNRINSLLTGFQQLIFGFFDVGLLDDWKTC